MKSGDLENYANRRCCGYGALAPYSSLDGLVIGALRRAHNKAVKPFACGSLGRSALRARSRMASPLLRDQSLHAERRLPGR